MKYFNPDTYEQVKDLCKYLYLLLCIFGKIFIILYNINNYINNNMSVLDDVSSNRNFENIFTFDDNKLCKALSYLAVWCWEACASESR